MSDQKHTSDISIVKNKSKDISHKINHEHEEKISTNKKHTLPILFIRNIVLFPGILTPLFVGRDKSVNAVNYAFKNNSEIIISTQKRESEEIDPKNVFNVGVIAKIVHMSKTSENNIRILIEAKERIKINKFTHCSERSIIDDFYFVDFLQLTQLKPQKITSKLEALKNSIVKNLTELSKISAKVSSDVLNLAGNIDDITTLHNVLISSITFSVEEKQKMLECDNIEQNFKKLYEITKYELDVIKYEKEINDSVKDKLKNDQKKYYLNEQKKVIEDELEKISPHDEKSEHGKYIALAKKNKLPQYAFKKVEEEATRLKSSSSLSSESGIIKNYLDFITSLPWSKSSKDNINISNAKDTLDKWHFGLDKVKERILEYIAIQSRSSKPKGQILCLYGPPGVGKTSLAKSIAEAMGKKYAKISLGGVRDEAEIRGHRKTYIGAFAGKILTSLKNVETNNPLILLDEIDKVGVSHRGDVTSALLEVLDPEQNTKFSDHYLEIPFDLSNIVFIATANTLDMPQPLLDRMEIINVTGYTEGEKLNICQKYIVPKAFEETELKKNELEITKDAMIDAIRYYTRESGVRELNRQIKKICAKVVKDIVLKQTVKTKSKPSVKSTNTKILNIVSSTNLANYLGIQKYHYGLMEKQDQIGVVTGLAYTAFGGDILKIEAIKIPSSEKGELKTTGKLGDVIKESVQAAFSYAQLRAGDYSINPDDFRKHSVHIHFPEGAVPKDGPSAGCAITLAILSLFSNKKVRKDIAMTGEITIKGNVLPIGGLKEKLTAALRSGITTVFIPEDNKKDLEEIPAEVTKALKIIPVTSIDQITKIALVR